MAWGADHIGLSEVELMAIANLAAAFGAIVVVDEEPETVQPPRIP